MLNATKRFNLTARSFHKVLKVARTIADLENSEKVLPKHVFEAINCKVNKNLF